MDLGRVDLNLLVSLDVLLAELNVTRAASRLHVSQPAMSAQLARLRKLFGDPLLVPIQKGRSMTPTSRALALRGPLRVALKTIGAVIQSELTFDPLSDTRTFRIAASDNAMGAICVPLISKIQHQSGGQLQLSLNVPDPENIGRQMEEGEFDILIDSHRTIPAGLKSKLFRDEEFVMAQRKGHPRGSAPPDLLEYCNLDHLVVSSSRGRFWGYMDDHLAKLGVSRRISLTVPQAGVVADILQHTNLVCTMPKMLIDRYKDRIDTLPLPFHSDPFRLAVAWHPRDDTDLGVQWLLERILSLDPRQSAP